MKTIDCLDEIQGVWNKFKEVECPYLTQSELIQCDEVLEIVKGFIEEIEIREV